jgi:hypothetical protein
MSVIQVNHAQMDAAASQVKSTWGQLSNQF